MIAVSSKGRSFRALATYLQRGRTGTETERVAWTAGRHLPTDDPSVAATFMRATSESNARVQTPVYHLVLSFDPRDVVDRATMERIADRVLARMGLSEHQTVMVAHQDRAHQHIHLMVNRVHPTTRKAWDLSHEYRAIQRVLRKIEQEFGLHVTLGRLADAPERVAVGSSPFDRPDAAALTSGEVHQRRRLDAPALITRVRAIAPQLRDATSWAALEQRLQEQGFRLAPGRDPRTGHPRGLVITDGISHVRASRIDRDFSKAALERRFGVRYESRTAAILSPVERIAGNVRRLAYVLGARTRHYEITLAATDVQQRMRQLRHVNTASHRRRSRDQDDPQTRIAEDRAGGAAHVELRSRESLRGLPEVRVLKQVIQRGIRELLPPELDAVRRTLNEVEQLLWRGLLPTRQQAQHSVMPDRDRAVGRER
jgi:hypothetical protein